MKLSNNSVEILMTVRKWCMPCAYLAATFFTLVVPLMVSSRKTTYYGFLWDGISGNYVPPINFERVVVTIACIAFLGPVKNFV